MDVVISKSDSNLITNVSIFDPVISESFAIMLKLDTIKPSPAVKKTSHGDLN